MSFRIAEACARAAAAASADDRASPLTGAAPARRWFVAADPQTTPARFFPVLDRHGLRGEDGWLRPDAGLVSIGDHFDFPGSLEEVERPGREILAWLAAHPADRVVILAGNHDLFAWEGCVTWACRTGPRGNRRQRRASRRRASGATAPSSRAAAFSSSGPPHSTRRTAEGIARPRRFKAEHACGRPHAAAGSGDPPAAQRDGNLASRAGQVREKSPR